MYYLISELFSLYSNMLISEKSSFYPSSSSLSSPLVLYLDLVRNSSIQRLFSITELWKYLPKSGMALYSSAYNYSAEDDDVGGNSHPTYSNSTGFGSERISGANEHSMIGFDHSITFLPLCYYFIRFVHEVAFCFWFIWNMQNIFL